MNDLRDRGGSGEMRSGDRVGLAWRREISSHILLNADKIDLIEVALDEYVLAPTTKTHGLMSLMRELPTVLHGTTLGLSSLDPLDELRMERLRRILDRLGTCDWSERLVDPTGQIADFDTTQANLDLLCERLGRAPDLETAAHTFSPRELHQLCITSGADLLLDLQDIYAVAIERGEDPLEHLLAYPLALVRRVHLSGEDHHHDISEPVFGLLEELAVRTEQPLSVVIERDGNFPPFSYLLHEVARAREALNRGRRRREPYRETPVICITEARSGSRV